MATAAIEEPVHRRFEAVDDRRRLARGEPVGVTGLDRERRDEALAVAAVQTGGDAAVAAKPSAWRRRGRGLEPRLFPGPALVPTAPLARLAEPVIEGRLTRNGLAALRAEGCELPPYDVVGVDKEYVWAEP